MPAWFRHSLPVRAGLAVGLIALLTLASTFSAAIIAWKSQGDAAAINLAGSLRMSAYRLAWQHEAGAATDQLQRLIQDMESRLYSPLLAEALDVKTRGSLPSQYQTLLKTWNEQLRPALEQPESRAYGEQVDAFVQNLNSVVLSLQHGSESKQVWQQTIQGIAMFITVVVLFASMHDLLSNVISPLQELMRTTEQYRQGNHRARASHTSDDELGQMIDSFNAMAEVVEDSHRQLEEQVRQTQAHLARANAALQLLHHSTHSVVGGPVSADRLNVLVEDFRRTLPGLHLVLCLDGDESSASQRLALDGTHPQQLCRIDDCDHCPLLPAQAANSPAPLHVDIGNHQIHLGKLSFSFSDGRQAESWEMDLIHTLADLIATALTLEQQREQDRLLVLMDERTVIARELHDSLAQSLSYIKLQIARLQTLTRRGEGADTLLAVTEDIREGVNSAYRQLRELLTTFRLQINPSGLVCALEDTGREFAERGELDIQLHLEPLPCPLSASEEIHLLQIAREALSNCVRHAQASLVNIHLRTIDHQRLFLSITDNGCGLTLPSATRQHHGINIMRERSRSLQGKLQLESPADGGTRVSVTFQPIFLRHNEAPLNEALS